MGEFCNIGKWHRCIQNVYFNGHYKDNDVDSIMIYIGIVLDTIVNVAAINFLCYDGDASEP